ncbi:MAG TPA: phosphatase PAP2 family protein [Armatimonadota bacterium]|jgi:membrane-associated phospholipid phosphatase
MHATYRWAVILVALMLAAPLTAHAGGVAQTLSDADAPVIGLVTADLLYQDARGSDPDQPHRGRQMVECLAINQAATELIKRLAHDPRPDDPDAHDGFPSGHTSAAFCMARVLDRQDHRWALPAYAFAAAVGWSRVDLRRHTAGQALGGMVVGYLSGSLIRTDRRAVAKSGLLADLADRLLYLPDRQVPKYCQESPAWGLQLGQLTW